MDVSARARAGPILVTGGTGTLGRSVVRRLRDQGVDVSVLSRSEGQVEERLEFVVGDLQTGAGVDAAVAGAATIIHCASARKGDVDMTANLVRAAAGMAARPHLVFVSIVGADRVTFGYIRAKLAAEQLISSSGLPWTLLRATQFYDLILSGARTAAKLPLVPIPSGMRVRPVDPDEVAGRLVELALSEPAGRVRDFAGPQETDALHLIRAYLRASGRRRPTVPIWLPGLSRVRAGAFLPDGAHDRGRRTWEGFLADKVVSEPP